MSRAGLVSLVLLFLYITLAASVPLPERRSSDIYSFAARSGDFDHDLVTRSLDFDLLEERGFDIADGNYYTREVADPLYRRSKIVAAVKQSFQKAGAATKQVFQKAGAVLQKHRKTRHPSETKPPKIRPFKIHPPSGPIIVTVTVSKTQHWD